MENKIEFSGISDFLPKNPTTYTQTTLKSDLCIPTCKPGIKNIIKVNGAITILNSTVATTPVATSLEGEILTGYMVNVQGIVKHVVIYMGDETCNALYSITVTKPFCCRITLPKNYVKGTPLNVIPYIEDMCVPNCCSIWTTLLLDVKFCCPYSPGTQFCNNCRCECSCNASTPKIIGIADVYPANMLYFKEVVIQEEIEIDCADNSIGDILSISSTAEVLSVKLLNTTIGTSLEGQNLTGYVLEVTLKINEMIIYSNRQKYNRVQGSTLNSGRHCTYVVVPEQINGKDINDLVAECKLVVIPYIEAICARLTNEGTIYKCTTLILNVST